ncbi:hypothetical protein GGTG_11921 [Gaeumannomyces tritici R3-111a-1]|uniref:Uncharacterized protein n=1 Tax=Gaeumannomyces tritici (strain R3-111a-1) TaxID=644352 RepID=J3PEJ0_GAET3|nr:hypothetical protein GGTG_11921 [Gaeumannomyces tritici R3-111a-1]EJT70898.1 hypothetical protein GGTG_11921 [Gaeumannomyces tritici R3-111a-1]
MLLPPPSAAANSYCEAQACDNHRRLDELTWNQQSQQASANRTPTGCPGHHEANQVYRRHEETWPCHSRFQPMLEAEINRYSATQNQATGTLRQNEIGRPAPKSMMARSGLPRTPLPLCAAHVLGAQFPKSEICRRRDRLFEFPRGHDSPANGVPAANIQPRYAEAVHYNHYVVPRLVAYLMQAPTLSSLGLLFTLATVPASTEQQIDTMGCSACEGHKCSSLMRIDGNNPHSNLLTPGYPLTPNGEAQKEGKHAFCVHRGVVSAIPTPMCLLEMAGITSARLWLHDRGLEAWSLTASACIYLPR